MVSSGQLREADVTQDAADARVRSGRWYRRHRGVYSFGPPRVTLGESRSTKTIHVHRGRLEPHEITHDPDYGFPVTSPMRALLDCATTLTDFRLQRAVHRAAELNLLDASYDPAGRPGAARLRAQVTALATEPLQITRSQFEERFLEFIHEHGIAPPLLNHIVNGHEVDAYWPHARLIVELDSREWHDTARAFEEDRARDFDHVEGEDRVLRLTWRRLTPRTAQRLHRLLA